jgi:HlyD family secretion protein
MGQSQKIYEAKTMHGGETMKKRVFALIGILTLLGVLFWVGFQLKFWGTKALEDSLYSGTIEATMVPIQPEQGGKLLEVLVEEGQTVKTGDVLARIDDRAAKIALESAKGQLRQAEAKLNDLLGGARSEEVRRLRALLNQVQANEEGLASNLKFEEKTLKDLEALYSAGAASQKELDIQQNKLNTIKAQHEAAKAQVEAAQASLDQALAGFTEPTVVAQKAAVDIAKQNVKAAELVIEKLEIKSPIQGSVFYRHVEPGQVINAGTRIITLMSPEDLWVKIYVPETELNHVKMGGGVRISVDAYPDQVFKGEIQYISNQAEFTPKNVQTREERTKTVYAVKIRITEGKDVLKAGMPADVSFQ